MTGLTTQQVVKTKPVWPTANQVTSKEKLKFPRKYLRPHRIVLSTENKNQVDGGNKPHVDTMALSLSLSNFKCPCSNTHTHTHN